MDFTNAIDFGLKQLSYKEIRENQKRAIEAYLQNKDVFFCSPTGSGKSLTFEIAPFVFEYLHKENPERQVFLVISPLTSLMKYQASSLQNKGITAIYLRDAIGKSNLEDNLTYDNVKDGRSTVILASPESLLEHQRTLLMNLSKKKLIKVVFVDEAHCIKKYGKPDKRRKQAAYRPCYGKLGEIRSLISGNVPVVALTATATKETKNIILKDLCMENCTQIIVNPDKKNITYWVHNLLSDDIATNFQWLVELLRQNKIATTRMIIFFRQIKHISEVYEHLEISLGRNAFHNYNEEGPNDDRNRLFDMFHMKTDDDVKDNICASYQNPDGNIRVVLCSTSFSMGLDVKGVDVVIHYGPANDIDDYMQESGRAGRDPLHNCDAILLTYKRCLGSRNITDNMKKYSKLQTCRRQFLLSVFDAVPESRQPLHLCCDICREGCTCSCKCENECNCTVRCKTELPMIYNLITTASNDLNDDVSSSEQSGFSSGSEVEMYLSKKPQVICSSDDELF